MVLSGDLSAGLRHRRRTAVQIAWLSYATSSAACAPENVRVVDTNVPLLVRLARMRVVLYASKPHTIFKRADSCEVRGEIRDRRSTIRFARVKTREIKGGGISQQ